MRTSTSLGMLPLVARWARWEVQMRGRGAVVVVVVMLVVGVVSPAWAGSPAAGLPAWGAVPDAPAGTSVAQGPGAGDLAPEPPLASYEPLSPARLADTRAGGSTVDGLFAGGGAVGPGATLELLVTGRGGVPVSGVGAVVVNVTATGGSAASHLTVFPSGETRPNASNLNFVAGQTVPNLVVAKVGAGGKVSIRNNSGSTHVIVDVAGWLHTGTNQLDPAAVLVERSAYTKVSTDPGSGLSTFSYRGAERLRVGTVLVGKGSVTPTVLETEFWKVTKADTLVAGVRRFEAVPGTLRDAYPTLDLHVTADSGTSVMAATTSGGVPVDGVSVTMGPAPRVEEKELVKCDGEINPVVDVDIDLSLGQFSSTLEWGWFEVEAVGFSWTPRGRASYTAGLEAEGSCTIDEEVFNTVLPPITFSIGPVPVVLTQNVTGTVKGSISGHGIAQFTNTAEFSGSYGFLWTEGTGFDLIDTIEMKVSIVPQLSVEVDANVGFEARYYLAAYGIVGVTMSLTPYAGMEASAVLKGLPPDTVWWVDGSLRAGVRAGLGVGVPLLRASWEPLVLDIFKDFPFSVHPTVPPAPDLVDATAVSVGADHSCARMGDSTVRCWGANDEGQLGDGTTNGRPWAYRVHGITDAVDVAAGDNHTCALRANGMVLCWGRNARGELGDGTTTNRVVPVTVTGLGSVVQLAAGGDHTCARLADGTVRCWGANDAGQLGDGTTAERRAPVTVSLLSGATDLTAGLAHTCAIGQAYRSGSNLDLLCWGSNAKGELGLPANPDPSCEFACVPATATRPTVVAGYTDPIAVTAPVDVDAGSEQTCVVRRTYSLASGSGVRTECWGEYGLDGLLQANQPDIVEPGTMGGAASAVSVGRSHACVRSTDSTLWCFGRNEQGQLGNGTEYLSTTLQPVAALSGATAVAAGVDHSCAVVGAGRVLCWGRNLEGQLGNVSTVQANNPTAVKTPSG